TPSKTSVVMRKTSASPCCHAGAGKYLSVAAGAGACSVQGADNALQPEPFLECLDPAAADHYFRAHSIVHYHGVFAVEPRGGFPHQLPIDLIAPVGAEKGVRFKAVFQPSHIDRAVTQESVCPGVCPHFLVVRPAEKDILRLQEQHAAHTFHG